MNGRVALRVLALGLAIAQLALVMRMLLISGQRAPERAGEAVSSCTEAAQPFSLEGVWYFFAGHNPEFALTSADETRFKPVEVPSYWEHHAPGDDYDGHGWYRKHFPTPNPLPCRPLGIALGMIDDVDEVFLNGVKLGGTGSFPPEVVGAPYVRRVYPIPLTALSAPGAQNVLAVHVFDAGDVGGIVSGPIQVGDLALLGGRLSGRDLLHILAPIVLLLVGLQHLFQWLYGTGRRSSLFFFLFALWATVLSITRGQVPMLVPVDLWLVENLGWLSVFLLPAVLLAFLHSHLAATTSLLWWTPSMANVALAVAGAIALDGVVWTHLFSEAGRYLVALSMLHALYLLSREAFENHSNDAMWLLGGVSLMVVMGGWDLFASGLGRTQPGLLPLSFVLFSAVVLVLMALGAQRDADALGELARTLEGRVEARTRALQRMVESLRERNEDLGIFASNISHDLRSPLVTVETLSDLLAQDEAVAMSERSRENVRYIRDGVLRIRRLLDGVTRLSRIGRSRREQTVIELSGLVAEVCTMLAADLAAADATVYVEPDLPAVRGFQSDLSELFLNLISNAIRHHPGPAPKVWVRVYPTDRADELPLGVPSVVICVDDDGPGVPADQREKIFRPFSRGPDARGDGQGVGLAVCRRAVDYAGGRIWVADRPGGGASFRVALPVA